MTLEFTNFEDFPKLYKQTIQPKHGDEFDLFVKTPVNVVKDCEILSTELFKGKDLVEEIKKSYKHYRAYMILSKFGIYPIELEVDYFDFF